jgi:acetyl-CoA C-acetyltransferase
LSESAEFTQFFGATFTSLNAMLTRLYMQQYGVTRDELSAFAVFAHKNASFADHAHFRKQITSDDVARSMIVSDPLRLLDCAPVGDGAAAILMVSEEKASEIKNKLVELKSSTMATNSFNFYERDDMLDFSATKSATEKALSKACISIKDLDFIEVHDAFTIMAALSVEAIGLSDKGKGAKDAKAGRFDLNSEVPINTFGGLKARGNPIGATGVYQIAEAYMQLTNQAGQNQVGDAEFGMTHSLGGIDTTSIIHILRGVD